MDESHYHVVNLRLVLVAQTISQLGDWAIFVAMPFFIYAKTDSPFLAAIIFAIPYASGILFSVYSGIIADRYDRLSIMIAMDIVRVLVLSATAFFLVMGYIWTVFLVLLIHALAAQLFTSAEDASLPSIVGSAMLHRANYLSSTVFNITMLLGAMCGGILLDTYGMHAVIILDILTFGISAVLITRIVIPNTDSECILLPIDRSDHQSMISVYDIFRMTTLRILLWSDALIMFGEGISIALLVVFIDDVMNAGATELGFIRAARAIGGICVGLFSSKVIKYTDERHQIVWSVGIFSILFLLFIQLRILPIMLFISVLDGMAVLVWFASERTIIQQYSPEHSRGRVFGTFRMVRATATLSGILVAGLLTEWFGTITILQISCVMFFAAAVLLWKYL